MNNMGNRRSYDPNKNFINNQGYANNVKRNEGRRNDYVQNNANRERNPRNNERKRNKNSRESIYGNICNTMQKKFNMTLYKGPQNVKNGEVNVEYANRKKSNVTQYDNSLAKKNNRVQQKKNNSNAKSNGTPRFNVIESKSSLNKNKQERVQYNRNFDKMGKNNSPNKNINPKDRKSVVQAYKEEKLKTEFEDDQDVFPKSAFIFITIALVFVIGVVVLVTQKNEVGNKIASIKKESETQASQVPYDGGLDFDSSLDSNQDVFEEEDVEEQTIDEEDDEVAGGIRGTAKPTGNNTPTGNTTSNKNNTTSNKNNNNNTSNKQVNSNTQNNTSNNNTQNNTSNDEEDEEDDVDETEEEMVYIPFSVTGKLYYCTGTYGGYGSGFTECTNFEESGSGVKVPKRLKNSLWADVKGTKIYDCIAYKDGVQKTVVKITVTREGGNTTTLYAVKGALISINGSYVDTSTGGTVNNSFYANEDMELLQVVAM